MGPLVLGLVAVAVLAGCDDMPQTRLDFSNTEKVAVSEIRILGGSGDVTVRGTGPSGQIRVDRIVRYHGEQPTATYRIAGTVLHVDTACRRRCSITYDIQAPPGVAVRGENGSGDLELSDVAAVDVEVGSGSITVLDASSDVAVETRSGNVTASRVKGDLTAFTRSGEVAATDIAGGTARVETTSGNVRLALSDPTDVTASATSGNIAVSVPEGRYRIDAEANSGDTDVDVPNDPGATHALTLRARSGNITVTRA
jgi:hypothetical protein